MFTHLNIIKKFHISNWLKLENSRGDISALDNQSEKEALRAIVRAFQNKSLRKVASGDVNFVEEMKEDDFKVTERVDYFHYNPLLIAVRSNNKRMVERILKSSHSIHCLKADPFICLYWAAEYGYTNILKALLKYDEVYSLVTSESNWVLDTASRNGHLDVVNILLNIDIVKESFSERGFTYITGAACNGHLGVISRLMELEHFKDNVKKWGYLALEQSALNEKFNVLKYLLQIDLIRNKVGLRNSSLMRKAIKSGLYEVAYILASCEWPNGKTDFPEKFSSFIPKIAEGERVHKGRAEGLQLLRAMQNGFGNTMKTSELYSLTSNGNKFLPRDIAQKVSEYVGIESHVCLKRNKENTEAFLETDIEKKCRAFKRARVFFDALDKEPLIKFNSQKIDEENNLGSTPLTYAVYNGDVEVTDALLKIGANPNKPNIFGDTATSLATQRKNKLGLSDMTELISNSSNKKPRYY